jgi:PIN domain nuclease of toxin-antitoxin system
MRLLLDTHAFVWTDSGDSKLPHFMRVAVQSRENTVYVSVATVWEIAIKRASGKLNFAFPIGAALRDYGFYPLPISVEHAEWAGALPIIHRDPFDRLLVAQAHIEGLTMVTVDPLILQYQVPHL